MKQLWMPFVASLVGLGIAATPAHAGNDLDAPLNESLGDSLEADTPVFILPTQVVSVSRVRETGLRTPASVTVIDTTRIEETVSLTPVDVTRTVVGLDFASKGLSQHTFAVRGDRSVNSTALLMMTDYRYAAIPSLGFNLPYLLAQSPSDIARIEVVRGAGAALYGPDSDKGVLHLITKSPFESGGTRVSASAGGRSVYQLGLRHASTLSKNWGIKFSGEYFRGEDWESYDDTEGANRAAAIAEGADPDTLLIGRRDFDSERWSGETRLDWRNGTGSSLTLTGGLARAVNTIDVTATAGAIQVRDWQYGYVQARGKHRRLFTNLYLNTSHAGDTYQLRSGDPVIDESRVVGAQVQHGADAKKGRFRFLYGADLRTTEPRTQGSINGRNEDNDTSTEVGLYVHSTSEVSNRWDLVVALRGDYHDRLDDAVVSPRLGVVYRPVEAQTFRMVYNRAFNSPSSTELFIDLRQGSLEGLYDVRVSGIPRDGFSFSRDCNGEPCMWIPTPGSPTRVPADATRAWPLLVSYLISQGAPPELADVPAPTAGEVGSVIATLDPGSQTAVPTSLGAITGIAPLKRTLTNTVELGYRGEIGGRASIQADLYYWHRKDPVGETYVGTPSVFFHEADLAAYLRNHLPDIADSLAAVIAGLPAGTISPDQMGASTDLLVLNKQGGSYDNIGADLAVTVELSRRLWAGLTYSWLLDNTYSHVDVLGNVVLGVPKNKGSVSLGYRDRRTGWSAALRGRVVESFPVVNGLYRGVVDAYGALDLDIQYRIPLNPEVRISLRGNNLLDNRHREFLGAPELGRLIVGRIEVLF